MRVSSALEAGTVWVNQYNLLNNNVPFGGKKQSGIGEWYLSDVCAVADVHRAGAGELRAGGVHVR